MLHWAERSFWHPSCCTAGILFSSLPHNAVTVPSLDMLPNLSLNCTCLCHGHTTLAYRKITLSPVVTEVGICKGKKKIMFLTHRKQMTLVHVRNISRTVWVSRCRYLFAKQIRQEARLPSCCPVICLSFTFLITQQWERDFSFMLTCSFSTSASLLQLPRKGPVW